MNVVWKHLNHIFMRFYVFFSIWLLFEAYNIIAAQTVFENIMGFTSSQMIDV